MKRIDNPKINLITFYFYPNVTVSTGRLLTELAIGLKEKGCDINVFTGNPGHWNTRINVRKTENFKGIHVHRIFHTQLSVTKRFGMILNGLTFCISLFLKLLTSKDTRLFLIVTVPPFLPYVLYYLQRLKRIQYILIVYDIYPDLAIAINEGDMRNNLIAKIWDKTFLWVYKKAARIVVLDRYMVSVVRKKMQNKGHNRIEIIQNWEDESFIRPLNKEENWFAIKHNLVNKFIVQYAGNLGLQHDLETLLEAAKFLKKEKTIKFLFIGDGFQKEKLVEKAKAMDLNNIDFLPFQPRAQLPYVITCSDIQIVSQKQGTEGLCVSCKLYSALAAGRPILAIIGKNSEIANVVKKYNCGIVVDNGDKAGLINAILKFQKNKTLRKEMGENARKCFEQYFTRNHAIDKYYKMIKNLWLQHGNQL